MFSFASFLNPIKITLKGFLRRFRLSSQREEGKTAANLESGLEAGKQIDEMKGLNGSEALSQLGLRDNG